MEDVLTEIVSSEDLKKFEKIYHDQLYENNVTPKAQFEYAWCLVRSRYNADIKKGIILLEELYRSHEEGQRDYLYYLSIGNARLKDYRTALRFISSFLSIEPGNQQVLSLETAVKKKMEKEGYKGMAITSGAVLAVGAIVGLVLAARK
ncbi:PREDICTED: mitochondrial fission 1 protein [Nicrophorus vespilloides]|uniref:Mitochondrial fission 1 protein n=1 Tax=Nicrophorus vespilloides TaxID=110193 RepID=A0ABM1M9X8_NICVS|nr:PREDICTED: mitochondrial fission 1 protein [Nicrophorus vespilloides]